MCGWLEARRYSVEDSQRPRRANRPLNIYPSLGGEVSHREYLDSVLPYSMEVVGPR